MAKRRPNGDGMIRKRADGRWEGRIVAGHKNNGKPIYRSVLAKTQKELTEKLHTLIETHKNSGFDRGKQYDSRRVSGQVDLRLYVLNGKRKHA